MSNDEELRKLERMVSAGLKAQADLDALRARLGEFREVVIDIPYRAIPKANKHKIAKRAGPGGRRRVVSDLTGALKKSEESFVTQALASLRPLEREGFPWDCPIEARVVFQYTPTLSWPKWRIEAARKGTLRYTKTPDLENVAKFVFDALEKVFYVDDKQIFRQVLEKRYGSEERVIVTLIQFPQATAKTWKDLPCD